MNWFDAIIIVVMLIFIIFGIKKGFMLSVIDLFGFFVNFVIALFLSKPMTSFLNYCGMGGSITSSLHEKYAGFGESFVTNLKTYAQETGSNITDFVNDAINSSPLTNFGKKLFNGTINNGLSDKLAASANENITLADIMSKSVAQFITVVVAFVICFVVIYLILLLLKALTKKLQQSSFINTFDKIFGACFGAVKGFIFFVLFFAVLSFFSDNGILGSVIQYINNSAIGGWLRSNVNTFMNEYINIKQFIIDILNKL